MDELARFLSNREDKDMKRLRQYIRRIILESMETPDKVIFMAGGPGSGKSTVIRGLNLGTRMTSINPDNEYEASLISAGLTLDRAGLLDEYVPVKNEYKALEDAGEPIPADLEADYQRLRGMMSQHGTLFNQARAGAKARKKELSELGEGFIVDGTGGNIREIRKQKNQYEALGYDCAMIFVDVPLEVSIERDEARVSRGGRSLGDRVVTRSWKSVNRNVEAYQEMFGQDFFRVDATSEMMEQSISEIRPDVESFLAR